MNDSRSSSGHASDAPARRALAAAIGSRWRARCATLAAVVIALALGAAPGLAWSDSASAPAGTDLASARPARPAEPFDARLVSVTDGDTLVARDASGRRHRIRIAGIDAPERQQAFANAARRRLEQLVTGHPLQVQPIKTDPFGRLVARILVDEADVGLAMVLAGYAWHFHRYEHEQAPDERRDYRDAQARARRERVGLWQDRAPEPPWDYRRRRRDP